jgi:hypothetical protein
MADKMIKFVDLVRTPYGIYEAPSWKVAVGDMVETKNGSDLKVLSVVTVNVDSEEYAFIRDINGRDLGKLTAVYHKEEFDVHE